MRVLFFFCVVGNWQTLYGVGDAAGTAVGADAASPNCTGLPLDVAVCKRAANFATIHVRRAGSSRR